MQGIRPENLTTRELLRYAYSIGYDKLPPDWVKVIVERLEAAEYKLADDLK